MNWKPGEKSRKGAQPWTLLSRDRFLLSWVSLELAGGHFRLHLKEARRVTTTRTRRGTCHYASGGLDTNATTTTTDDHCHLQGRSPDWGRCGPLCGSGGSRKALEEAGHRRGFCLGDAGPSEAQSRVWSGERRGQVLGRSNEDSRGQGQWVIPGTGRLHGHATSSGRRQARATGRDRPW